MDEATDRVSVRRDRISRRLKAQKGESIVEKIVEFDQEAIEKQLQDSSDVLQNLTLESSEMLSNVKVAGERRKSLQLARDKKECDERQEDLAAEARASWQRMETILAKWGLADENNDALELNALFNEQKRNCDDVLNQKDEMITRLKNDLLEREALYQQTLRDQWNDLKVASERVDLQVTELQQSQRDELALLEAVTSKCRGDQISLGGERWADLWETLQKTLNFEVTKREKLREDLALDEDLLHDRLAQCVHDVRLQLQKQSQDLGLQLQELQASCILNAEKMKLNIEILRARDQEARILRAEQKKKISKLQDKVRTLQVEYRQQQQESHQRRKILRGRVNKLRAENIAANATSNTLSVTKTQLKMLNNHYAKQATALVTKLMGMDETIHREQLCMPWSKVENFDSRLASLVHDLCEGSRSLPSTKSSSSEALQEASSLLTRSDADGCEQMKKFILTRFLESTVEFLAPENKNLQTNSAEEKTLLDLASCLSALGIETETELDGLFNALILHTLCETCEQKPFDISETCPKHLPFLEAKSILVGIKKYSQVSSSESDAGFSSPSPENARKPEALRAAKSAESLGWLEFLNLLPADLDEKWDNLLDGLSQHLGVLQDRHEINAQVGRIKKQNAELRHLLEMHTVAKLQKKQQMRLMEAHGN